MSYCSCNCDRIPDKKQPKKERFIFGSWSERIQSIMMGKAWQQEQEPVGRTEQGRLVRSSLPACYSLLGSNP